jgi:hypothetical protein
MKYIYIIFQSLTSDQVRKLKEADGMGKNENLLDK